MKIYENGMTFVEYHNWVNQVCFDSLKELYPAKTPAIQKLILRIFNTIKYTNLMLSIGPIKGE